MTELTHCVLCVLLVPLSLLYSSTTVNCECNKKELQWTINSSNVVT